MSDHLSVRPSRSVGLAVSLVLGHSLAAAAALMALPLLGGAAVAVLLALSLARVLRLHAWRTDSRSVQAIVLQPEEGVILRLRSGVEVRTRLRPSSYVSRPLIILNCKVDGRQMPVHVVLARDCLPPDDYRRLSVWLRWRQWAF